MLTLVVLYALLYCSDWRLPPLIDGFWLTRFDLVRVSRTPRGRRTFSGSFSSPKPMAPEAPSLQQGDANPQVAAYACLQLIGIVC